MKKKVSPLHFFQKKIFLFSPPFFPCQKSVCPLHAFFFISTSNFKSSLAGAYFQTDFGQIFTIPLPLFMRLKCFLLQILHEYTNRSTQNWSGHWFYQKKLAKFQTGCAYRGGALKKSVYNLIINKGWNRKKADKAAERSDIRSREKDFSIIAHRELPSGRVIL